MSDDVRVSWIVVCQRAAVDQVFNDVTLFSCIEAMTFGSFPAELGGMEVVVAVHARDPARLAPGRFPARLTCEPPGRDPVVVFEGDFEVGEPRVRGRYTISPFTFKSAGRYWFVFSRERGGRWEELARTPIDAIARDDVGDR